MAKARITAKGVVADLKPNLIVAHLRRDQLCNVF
jgi:hypothetical protein